MKGKFPLHNSKNSEIVTITAFRHGPTAWNLERRIQGNSQKDILPERIHDYLSKIGAARLSKPDGIIVSQLRRTTQTAQALIQMNNWIDVPLLEDARLNEKKWGIFEGVTDAVARQRIIDEPLLRPDFPDVKSLEDVASIWEDPLFKVPGGESSGEVRSRMLAGLRDITQNHAGENLIMVSHAGALISLGLDHHIISGFTLNMSMNGEEILLEKKELH